MLLTGWQRSVLAGALAHDDCPSLARHISLAQSRPVGRSYEASTEWVSATYPRRSISFGRSEGDAGHTSTFSPIMDEITECTLTDFGPTTLGSYWPEES